MSEWQAVCPEQSWLPLWDSPTAGDLSISSLYKAPAHHGGPNYDPPPSPYDRRLHRLLNVARNQGPSLGLPTVADFIHDDSPNPLSKELKMYKGSLYRQQKPVEFLASYWILYLLLRWRVTLEQDALENMPLWMHPTKLQRDVEHLSVIDQVVWPDLREEIIKLSFVDLDAACVVLYDIGQNFVINIEDNEASTAETIRQIVGKLSDLARWKLAPRFFEKHPQWAWTSAR
ncbi:hypothetical protein F5X68DRAFT_234602 [Plectosphaerella plurivora]|uniref:Uncharacterized protein n=1 Tax=Plectosphaerella plurivora TaxID=936078 RepID=A0A9P9A7X9_9PEZI|nr:hypothetical protein F5X68DRAFT_234602 [Plectosphaerella plurivora]